jgi:hypothetical protein
MAKIAASDLQKAASRVSSTLPTRSRRTGGSRDAEKTWDLLAGKAARALISEPDLVFYFAYLHSNRTSAAIRRLLPTLDAVLAAAEGLNKEAAKVNVSESSLSFVRSAIGRSPDAANLAAIEQQVEGFLADELVPQIKTGSRLQKKGPEAKASYAAEKRKLLGGWKNARLLIDGTARGRQFTPSLVQQSASEVPLSSLEATLALPPPPTQLAEYTLQVAAALSAVKGMTREVHLMHRVLVDDSSVFPVGIELSSTAKDGVITRVELGFPPKVLGIRSGDEVFWGRGTATVAAVDGEGIDLASSTITAAKGRFKVSAAPSAEWSSLSAELSLFLKKLPLSGALAQQLAQKEGPSAAETRDLLVLFCTLYAKLDSLPESAETLLRRVGGTVPSQEPVLAVLDSFSPFFPKKLVKVGDALLAELDREGFDFARETLLRGDVDQFLRLSALGASKKSRVIDEMRILSGKGL